MSKYLPVLLSLLAAPVWAGSSSINLPHFFETVFSTPSGNVLCGSKPKRKTDIHVYNNDLYCVVLENKTLPKRCIPQGKGLDFTLNARGKAAMDCAGFEFEPENESPEQTRILNYGETIRGQGWECHSETTGLTCRNSQGRGFTMSRSRYELF